jgi:hypothetical protein
MGSGPDLAGSFRRGAEHVDRFLREAKPAGLPGERLSLAVEVSR